jgi:hypothetical protein
MALILSGTDGLSDVDGTAATPAIRGTDTNTGIYFGNDVIGFSEGGTQCGEFDASANFKFNSGYGSVATAYGCRAWVNFNGNGTPAIRASGNVSSITDNGTGDYTLNFTNALADTNYCALLTIGYGNSSSIPEASWQFVSGTWTTTSIRMRVGYSYTPPSVQDSAEVNVSIFR